MIIKILNKKKNFLIKSINIKFQNCLEIKSYLSIS